MTTVRLRLAPGVVRRGSTLWDPAMRRLVQLDPADLGAVPDAAGAPLELTEDSPAWEAARVLHDAGLIDAELTPRERRRAVWRLVRSGDDADPAWRMAATRRLTVPSASLPRIAGRIWLTLAHRWRWLLASFLALSLAIMALMRHAVPLLVPASLAPILLVLSGFALHEAGHLYALRLVTGDPELGWVRLGALGIGVRRPGLPPRETALVAAAGPLVPGIPGALAAVVGLLAGLPLLTLAALPLATHLLGLAPWTPDGRTVLSSLVPAAAPGLEQSPDDL